MNRRLPAVDLQRPVARVIMQEGPVAGELVLHVGELAAGAAGIDVVAAANGQRDTVAFRHVDAGGNDLDVEFVDLAGLLAFDFSTGLRSEMIGSSRKFSRPPT